jgi:hypothetical protein
MTAKPKKAPVRLHYEPLGEWVDTSPWCHYGYGEPAHGWGYSCPAPACFHLPPYAYPLLHTLGAGWETHPDGRIDVDVGYHWDGPSGPAVNDEHSIVGSLLHDILCTAVPAASGGWRYPCGYFTAHRVYREVCRAQGMNRWRAWYQWAALVLFNWIVRLDDKAAAAAEQGQ